MALFRIIILVLSIAMTGIALSFLPAHLKPERDFSLIAGAENMPPQQVLQSLQQMQPADVKHLLGIELNYLKSHPLDARSLQNYAILQAITGGDVTTSSELNLLLARYSLRNVGVQMIAINTLAAKNEFDEALFRLDATLRSAPEIKPQVFPTLVALVENKSSLPAVAKTLTNMPPWRKDFMNHIAKAEPTGQLTYQLLKVLRGLGGDLQSEELRNILSTWIETGQIEKAYFVWLDLLPPDELKSLKLIYDGEFNREARGHFFDWTLGAKKNVRMSIARKPGSAVDRSLMLDFFGYKGAFNHVSQLLRLAEGKHDIRYEVMSQNFKSEGGLTWRVYCLNATTTPLGASRAVNDSVPWTASNFQIEIPTEDCDTQMLRLESKARSGLDTAVTGQIFFDDFKIERKDNPGAQ